MHRSVDVAQWRASRTDARYRKVRGAAAKIRKNLTRTDRSSSTFLRRIVGPTFMRANRQCAHHLVESTGGASHPIRCPAARLRIRSVPSTRHCCPGHILNLPNTCGIMQAYANSHRSLRKRRGLPAGSRSEAMQPKVQYHDRAYHQLPLPIRGTLALEVSGFGGALDMTGAAFIAAG
jgi:hypothetical protein